MVEHFGRVYKEILKQIEEKKGLLFLVIDPPNQGPETSGKLAKIAEENGADAFAVGGSLGAQGRLLDDTISQIKSNSSLPVVLFPGNIATLSPKADAVYFMSMLNSLEPYYISGAQTAASIPVKRMGIECIPTSYVVVEPGRAVGWVGRAQLIPRNLPYIAAATALAGQFMGSHLVILESGGGAESPAPPEMVKAVKDVLSIPLVVAGGVRDEKFAYDTIKAGADIVHVGKAIETTNGNLQKTAEKISKLSAAIRKAGKEKK